jgi:cytoskeletal protein CcmA (bactofilin family)
MFGSKSRKPRRPVGHFDTLVSRKTSVCGDVNFSGGLHVDGRIEGRVIAEEGSDAVVRISEVGEVKGDIQAPHVIINGSVNGDVYSGAYLELAEKASIHGNVYYNLLEIAVGAEVNGNLIHQKEPVALLKKQAAAEALLENQEARSGAGMEADVGEPSKEPSE